MTILSILKYLKIEYLFIGTLLFIGLRHPINVDNITNRHSNRFIQFQIDTLEGFFLYEINAPEKCYTRFDQIEQGNALLRFDTLISKKPITEFYRRGIFIFAFQPIMQNYIKDFSIGAIQNKNVINNFLSKINNLIKEKDSTGKGVLYYDSKKLLSFKKVYLRLVVASLGYQKQLVPKTKKYKCCYSNTLEEINTFFIIDILASMF